MTEPIRELRGVISRLFTQNPTFCAGEMLPVKEDVTRRSIVRFAGKCYVREGEYVTLRGEFVDDPKWGRQWKVESRVHAEGLDAKGLAAWLAVHMAADGIGPVKAEKIAAEFGENFTGILRDDPEQVAIFAKVPLESIRRLRNEWLAHEEENSLGSKLASYGLTAAQIHSLYEKFKGSVTALLDEDPYLLVHEVPGLGFGRVDEIARKMGVPDNHPGRVRAAILFALGEFRGEGSTCAERQELIDAAVETLKSGESANAIADALEAMGEEAKELRSVTTGEGGARLYALPAAWRHEEVVAAFLRSANRPNPHAWRLCNPPDAVGDPFDGGEDEPQPWEGDYDPFDDGGESSSSPPDQFAPATPPVDFDLGTEAAGCVADAYPELDDSQRRAVLAAVRNRACLVSGGAGSGKTFCINAVARLYARAGLRIALCAPTGKAARRLEEVTGRQASTIHRLLEYAPKHGGFQRNARNPIDTDVVVADEASMIDAELACHLFSAVSPNTAVVLVGDHHQLPPVGAGALLRDCIDRELLPLALLNRCHRQAGPLKRNAAAILLGELAPTVEADRGEAGPWYVQRKLENPEDVLECVERLFTKIVPAWGYDPVADVQFLTPQHLGPLGTLAINALLQRLHQWTLGVRVEPVEPGKRPKLHVRDKVIQTRNNYSLNVMNGHQGMVLSVSPLVVEFDGRTVAVPSENRGDIELAYCLTPHKVQGSEFPCIVAVYHRRHSFMTHRNHLYTAATRATKTCVLLGDDRGLRHAAATVRVNRRLTLLPVFLCGDGGGGREPSEVSAS